MPIPEDALVLRGLGVARQGAERFGLCFVVAQAGGPRKLLTVERRRSGLHVAHAIGGGVHRSYSVDGATHTRTGAMKIDARQLQPLASFTGLVLFQQGTSALDAGSLSSLPTLEPEDQFDEIVQIDPSRIRSRRLRHDVWLVEPFRHGQIPIPPDRSLHLTLTTHTNPWIVVVLVEDPVAAPRRAKKAT